MRAGWRPARPDQTPGQLVPGEDEDDVPMPRPHCSIGGGFRLTTLALGGKRIRRLRREWPRPVHKRLRQRRPGGQRPGSAYT